MHVHVIFMMQVVMLAINIILWQLMSCNMCCYCHQILWFLYHIFVHINKQLIAKPCHNAVQIGQSLQWKGTLKIVIGMYIILKYNVSVCYDILVHCNLCWYMWENLWNMWNVRMQFPFIFVCACYIYAVGCNNVIH